MSDRGPEQVMNAYRAELRRLYGDDRADKTKLYHIRGWYYLKLAQRFHDGSVGAIGIADCYRKKQIIEMTENLRRREL